MSSRVVMRVAVAVMLRPRLWAVALRQMLRLAEPGWWMRFPPLPLPPPDYVHFRLVTAYGGDGSCSAAELSRDVVAYLDWCR